MDSFLPRIHLFEWEDQTFFPSEITRLNPVFVYGLDSGTVLSCNVACLVSSLIKPTGRTNIYDLCSGGGENLVTHLARVIQHCSRLVYYLTDYYPNIPAFESLHARSTVRSPSTLGLSMLVLLLFQRFYRHNAARLSSFCLKTHSKFYTMPFDKMLRLSSLKSNSGLCLMFY